jgi:serpin B
VTTAELFIATGAGRGRSLSESRTQLKGSKMITKVLAAGVIVLLVSSNLALTRSLPENQVDNRLTAASTRFSFKLYDQILKQPTGKNTFVSPASVMLALAMTYNGADGTTREGMARTLEIEGMSLADVNLAFANLKSALTPGDPHIQVKIANSLWARQGFTLNPGFVERNKQHYAAEIASLDFSSPTAPDMINSWVNKNTAGKIQKIIDRIHEDDVLFLINAIYFKGQWQFPFNKQDTKPDVFRLAGGEQKQVQMMSRSGSYFYTKGKGFQAVALPYGSGRVSMYVFLPDEQTSLDQFQQDLTAENWDAWMKTFGIRPGDVKLPQFKVEWESKLNDALKALGMAEAFDSRRADFSLIAKPSSGDRLYISEARHKSWCEVNEEGTVAAAATSITGTLTSLQPEKFLMKVDRPFFFAIRDNPTGVVLFMGSVTNPG